MTFLLILVAVSLLKITVGYTPPRLEVHGHTGIHSKAMGTYGLDARLAFGLPRFVQLDLNGLEPFFLYRAGSRGRWIIVQGEDAVNNQQCVH